jgi:predicted alpha/beta hydrolase family esterase
MQKRQILFVQGGGKGTYDEWDDKLVASLQQELGADYEIQYPRMPNEEEPSYALWKAALEREFATLRDGAILVGHSVGGTILVSLTEQLAARRFGAILLIAAPFVGDGGWSADDLQFSPEHGARLPKGVPIHFFHGLADEVAPASHVDLYTRAVPQAHIHRLPGRDHQLNNDLKEVAAVILQRRRARRRPGRTGCVARGRLFGRDHRRQRFIYMHGDAPECIAVDLREHCVQVRPRFVAGVSQSQRKLRRRTRRRNGWHHLWVVGARDRRDTILCAGEHRTKRRCHPR